MYGMQSTGAPVPAVSAGCGQVLLMLKDLFSLGSDAQLVLFLPWICTFRPHSPRCPSPVACSLGPCLCSVPGGDVGAHGRSHLVHLMGTAKRALLCCTVGHLCFQAMIRALLCPGLPFQ